MSEQKNQITLEQLKELMSSGKGTGIPQKNMTPAQLFRQKLLHSVFQKMQKLLHHVDRFINFITKKTDGNRNDVVQSARSPILFGVYVIIIFVGIGGLWSIIAPLNSAVIAIGKVISNTNKKLIQHQEGGIIKHIFVAQGDRVKEGDKLIEFDDTKTKAQYENTLHQYRSDLASENRLVAERDNLDTIEFAEILKNTAHIPEVAKIMHTQENLFRSKKEMYRSEKESCKQKIAQLNKQIEGIEFRKISVIKNLEVTRDRLKAMRTLKSKGFVQKSTLLELEAKEANFKSELATLETEVARNHQEITKTEIDIINLQNKSTTETLRELRETQIRVASFREQLLAVKDQLNRIIIKSPVDGIINVIHYHTIGGVIPPGAYIMEITPLNDLLIIEAQVPHKNIDSVHVGLTTKIRFSAFKSRTTPLFTGKVISISPDLVQDKEQAAAGRMSEPSYIARIEIDMDEFNKVAKAKKLALHPGMQAEVQIVTGTRTLFRYLLDPVTDTMFKAFREK